MFPISLQWYMAISMMLVVLDNGNIILDTNRAIFDLVIYQNTIFCQNWTSQLYAVIF